MTDNSTPREGLLAIGTTLANGKYRIEKYLASGGFGNTYMAIDTAFDERVAIKELFIKGVCGRMDNATDISISLTENQRTFNAQREKFRKEARRLRKLENKHIVRVHDLFDENGTTYYVMDFIEGESLSTRLKRTHQPMTEAEVLPILAQVLDALETVHNEGIWHLDLKPANIMVDDKDNVQLIDFGASKQLRNADGNSLSTSSAWLALLVMPRPNKWNRTSKSLVRGQISTRSVPHFTTCSHCNNRPRHQTLTRTPQRL